MKHYILILALLSLTAVVRADAASDLAERKAAFPASPLAQSIDPYARDCSNKYSRAVASVTVKNARESVKMILAQIDSDLRGYDEQAKGNPLSKSSGRMVTIAGVNAKWLRESVRPFVQSLAPIK